MHQLSLSAPWVGAPTIDRLADGSIIADAVPMIGGQTLTFYAYELPPEITGEAKWDTPFQGHLSLEAAESTLDQFEGLAITSGHVVIETGKRSEVAVGNFLTAGAMDGDKVRARALIYDAAAIIIATGDGAELSIGGMSDMSLNEKRGQPGEPDFFISNIRLNHVALVEAGRAGPEARLLNHKATLESLKMTEPQNNGMDALKSQIDALGAQVAALTAERDLAQGQVSAANAEIANMKANSPDVMAEAVRLANSHAAFAEEAVKLGRADALELGKYDRVTVMREVLNARGAKLPETASEDMLSGAWLFAVNNAAASPQISVIDTILNAKAMPSEEGYVCAEQRVRNNCYGGAKK